MRFSKAIIPIALCIMLLSLAAPAQKRKGRAAKPRKPASSSRQSTLKRSKV